MLRFQAVFIGLLLTTSLAAQTVLLDSLKAAYQRETSDTQRINLMNEIAHQTINSDPIVAKDDVIIAYDMAKRAQFMPGVARSLMVMGGVYWGFGNYQQALAHYLDALKEFQELEDVDGRANCLNNIGEVYKKLGEYNNALDYLKHSLALKEQLMGKGKSALSYSNLGELYTLMGQYENAKENYEIALKAASETNDIRVMSYATDGLGTLNFAQGNFNKAISYFHKAITLREQVSDIRGMAYAHTNMGRSYFRLNQYDSAQIYYQKALNESTRISANDVRSQVFLHLAQLDSIRGNYTEAYFNYLKHDNLKDSLFNSEKSAQIARMQAEYETEILKRDNEAKEAEVSQRNTLIIAVIMLLLLTLALAGAFYSQRTVQEKANSTLKSKNEQIAKQNLEIQSQTIKLQSLNENLENLNKNLEAKIKERTEQLEKKNKELAEYAFIHAHELRAPLANMLGLVELLKHVELSEKDKETVTHLYTATAQLDQVIRNIASREQQN